mgnify:CR=1 FL=1
MYLDYFLFFFLAIAAWIKGGNFFWAGVKPLAAFLVEGALAAAFFFFIAIIISNLN